MNCNAQLLARNERYTGFHQKILKEPSKLTGSQLVVVCFLVFQLGTWLDTVVIRARLKLRRKLLWRALKRKFLTDERLATFGKEASDCFCCHNRGTDTIEHIFVAGNLAKYIWSYFSASLRLEHETRPLRNLIMQWWLQKPKKQCSQVTKAVNTHPYLLESLEE